MNELAAQEPLRKQDDGCLAFCLLYRLAQQGTFNKFGRKASGGHSSQMKMWLFIPTASHFHLSGDTVSCWVGMRPGMRGALSSQEDYFLPSISCSSGVYECKLIGHFSE